MPKSKDKSENPQTEAPAESISKPVEEEADFGPMMSLEEAEALRKGCTIGMEEFNARFDRKPTRRLPESGELL